MVSNENVNLLVSNLRYYFSLVNVQDVCNHVWGILLIPGRRNKNVRTKTAALSAFETQKAIEKAGGPSLNIQDDVNLMSRMIH